MKKIVVKTEFLAQIKDDDKFINAIQLGRILAAIRYNKILHAIISKDDKANTSLQLYLLLGHAASLYEGIATFKKTKTYYEGLSYYKNNLDKIAKILNEATNENSFLNKVFKIIRNKIAFHFDEDVIKDIWGKYVDDCVKEKIDVVVISGKSETVKDTTYLLADNMNINYILNLINEGIKGEKEKFIILSQKLLELSELFCSIVEELIPDLIKNYCKVIDEPEIEKP